jgi:hypothetical protein
MNVSIRLYDHTGREVMTITNEAYSPGFHQIETSVTDLAAGIYYYEMNAGFFKQSRALVISK